jgi:membrane protease subunit HflC
MRKLVVVLVVIAVVIIIFLLLGPFYTIQEGEQAVVTRFGKIVAMETVAGLKIKVPFVDTVVKYPKKIISWDGEAQIIPTLGKKFVWVDTTARWKITDPTLFYESVGTLNQAQSRLDDVIDSEVRKVIARNIFDEAVRNSNDIRTQEYTLQELADAEEEGIELSIATLDTGGIETIEKGRQRLSMDMLNEARVITPQYGIDLIDIVVRQIKYSDDLTESVYQRMIKERNQIAEAFRSSGEGEKAIWMGRKVRELNSIESNAYREAERIKGEADARAAEIYAEAYNQDPEFYRFWRAIESYRQLLPNFRKTLTTEPQYFDFLYDQEAE